MIVCVLYVFICQIQQQQQKQRPSSGSLFLPLGCSFSFNAPLLFFFSFLPSTIFLFIFYFFLFRSCCFFFRLLITYYFKSYFRCVSNVQLCKSVYSSSCCSSKNIFSILFGLFCDSLIPPLIFAVFCLLPFLIYFSLSITIALLLLLLLLVVVGSFYFASLFSHLHEAGISAVGVFGKI